MRYLPTILVVLAFPVGIVAYTIAGSVLSGMSLPPDSKDFIVLVVPLFAASFVMLPFLVPFFDRKAKADLAAYRASQAAEKAPQDEPEPSDGGQE